MNPEIKRRWVEALKSGEYAQGTDYLRKTDYDGVTRYCCLGVLCDLAAQDGIGTWCPTEGHISAFRTALDKSVMVLPVGVTEWADIPRSPFLTFTNEEVEKYLRIATCSFGDLSETSAVTANDGGTPFTVIADAIERSL